MTDVEPRGSVLAYHRVEVRAMPHRPHTNDPAEDRAGSVPEEQDELEMAEDDDEDFEDDDDLDDDTEVEEDVDEG